MSGDLRRGYRLAFCALALAWLAMTGPWLSGAVTIPYDAKAVFHAQLQFLANALHNGQSPFWNPNTYVGTPQIADPQSLIFTPAILLAYFKSAPTFRDLDFYVFALLGVGAISVLKIFQDKQWHPAGGVVAAIAFGFGASAAWRVQHIAQIRSYAFFALTLWLLLRALDRKSFGYAVLAGLSAGLMIAAPDQVGLLACYLLVAVVVDHWIGSPNWHASIRTTLGPLTVAGVVGILVAGIPLLVSFLFLAESNRPEMPMSEAAHGSLHPASLLTAVIADLYGAFDPKVDYWGPFSTTWDENELTLSQNMSQLYVGALPILLMLTVGLFRRVLFDREIRLYVLMLALMLVYALGTNTPAFTAMYHLVPGVAYFRRPADATFLVGGLAAIVGGYLVHRWASQTLDAPSPRRQLAERIGIALPVLAALAIASGSGKLAVAWQPIAMALGWLLATGVFLVISLRYVPRQSPVLIAGVALLMTADLMANNGPNGSTGLSPVQYDILKPNCSNATIQKLREKLRYAAGSPRRDRIELVGLGFDWPNISMIHGFDNTLGYNPLRLGVVSDAIGARDYIVGPEQRTFAPLFPSYRSTMANLLGLRVIASSIPIEDVDKSLSIGDLKLFARTDDGYLYENQGALPRALFVPNWQPADFKQILREGKWPRFDPSTTVLLEASSFRQLKLPSPSILHPPAQAKVSLKAYQNTTVSLEIDAPEDGMVVLNDLWHRWWRVTVDGKPTPILKANVMFRAVPVTAGHHKVEFEFAPIAGALQELREKLFGSEPASEKSG